MTQDDSRNELARMKAGKRYKTLAKCSAMVEATAFHLAGTVEASLVAKLISVAAVLDRLSEEVRAASGE